MFASMLYLRLTLLNGFQNFFSNRSKKKKFKVVLKKFRFPRLLEGYCEKQVGAPKKKKSVFKNGKITFGGTTSLPVTTFSPQNSTQKQAPNQLFSL